MNNDECVCLWCCVLLDFVVQIKNFFSFVLFSVVIHRRRGKKLISKAIKYELDSCSQIHFKKYKNTLKTFKKLFGKLSGNDTNSRGRRVMFFASL